MTSAAEGEGVSKCWGGGLSLADVCIQDTLSSRARLAECVARAKLSCIQC